MYYDIVGITRQSLKEVLNIFEINLHHVFKFLCSAGGRLHCSQAQKILLTIFVLCESLPLGRASQYHVGWEHEQANTSSGGTRFILVLCHFHTRMKAISLSSDAGRELRKQSE